MTDSIFICPICSSPLRNEGKSLYCTGEKRHCYDIAASGYVNLLPPGKKNNRVTGDDAEMLRCRRSFLSTGKYDLISDRAAEIALGEKENIASFADAGCGEGYHTVRIFEKLTGKFPSLRAAGFDASKKGSMAGAKASSRFEGRLSFAAANIFAMPLPDKSQDVIFSLFAPVPDAEAQRILSDDGILIVVSSGSRHLWQMREVLYGEPRISPPLSRVPEGFYLFSSASLTDEISLSHDEIADLFTMTPFYYRSPREGREKLLSLEKLTTEISAEYKVYRKK